MKSYFSFEIAQTVQVILYKMKVLAGKKWSVNNGEDGTFVLVDLKDECKITRIKQISDDELEIYPYPSMYKYVIKNLPKDGAKVLFNGPVNALLAQALMPRLTYIPNTMLAKSEDMEEWSDIKEFMEKRAERNADNPNPQDKNGWRVNMKFYNEFEPYLPPFHGTFKRIK